MMVMNNSEQQAVAWLTQLYKGEPSDLDKLNFVQWLKASKENAKAYKKIEQQWRDIALDDAPFLQTRSVNALNRQVEERTSTSAPVQKSQRYAWLGAAASILLVAITYIFWPQEHLQPSIWQTSIGESKLVNLRDGSEVTLGAASAISVDMTDALRQVNLQYGTAYFDIKKDVNAPFEVVANNAVISVVGTEFEVRVGKQNVRLIVAEGSVQLSNLADENMQNLGVLGAGDRVWVSENSQLTKDTVALDKIATWKDGRLTYVDTPLFVVIEDANRYRNMPIKIDSDSLKDMRITTSFNIEESEKLLTALTNHYEVQIKYASDGVYLSDK
ncbi:sensor [Agaribacter marinus]|uniref:Sensor n=2 Tax=Agaribacter marinus TaxID=1431249 RepID=A0AA37SXY7_9ALTE|nr:sensor [Agaribacter marinus]